MSVLKWLWLKWKVWRLCRLLDAWQKYARKHLDETEEEVE
jgi:hypothetical protein